MSESDPCPERSIRLEDSGLAYAYGGTAGHARCKVHCEDFVVEESLGFEPSGEGEHLFLKVQKRGWNTEDVALRLARHAGVARRDVGFAGLKDKKSLATQWFSIRLPKIADHEWDDLACDDALVVLERKRHARKLQRGTLASNRFRIRLRDVDADPERLETRLERIRESGVPNYFGPQRFGRRGRNLHDACRYFDGERVRGTAKRAMLLSAARSFLFNRILAGRVAQGTWNRAIAGDVLMFDVSKAYFKCAQPSGSDIARVRAGELHPSGVLWGLGGSDADLAAAEIESRVIGDYPLLSRGLESRRVESGRRAFRVIPRRMQWCFESQRELTLDFDLTRGAYATSVLREVLDCSE